eukprot:CAMPEP_0179858458 /NCGR_PEP_ID=MMETSP0982-20121206/12413_1 /TAXON_ID=483367 /ORGANISM="non described non described, Strain CCMP 2436" /LENGTH=168 /DNA_ID=CAMNT_0021745283 /DNA_START=364 /DNA_END=866 /DNA_ORIENTATION=-
MQGMGVEDARARVRESSDAARQAVHTYLVINQVAAQHKVPPAIDDAPSQGALVCIGPGQKPLPVALANLQRASEARAVGLDVGAQPREARAVFTHHDRADVGHTRREHHAKPTGAAAQLKTPRALADQAAARTLQERDQRPGRRPDLPACKRTCCTRASGQCRSTPRA